MIEELRDLRIVYLKKITLFVDSGEVREYMRKTNKEYSESSIDLLEIEASSTAESIEGVEVNFEGRVIERVEERGNIVIFITEYYMNDDAIFEVMKVVDTKKVVAGIGEMSYSMTRYPIDDARRLSDMLDYREERFDMLANDYMYKSKIYSNQAKKCEMLSEIINKYDL